MLLPLCLFCLFAVIASLFVVSIHSVRMDQGMDTEMVQKVLSKIVSEIENLQFLALTVHNQFTESNDKLLRVLADLKQEMENLDRLFGDKRNWRNINIIRVENLVKGSDELEQDINRIKSFCEDLLNLQKSLEVESKRSNEDPVDIKKVLSALSEVFVEDKSEANLGLKTICEYLEKSSNDSELEQYLIRIDALRKDLAMSVG